jgi:glycine/D-amino acid oxidase-like deaminating enzyme
MADLDTSARAPRIGSVRRLREFLSLLLGVRRHDLRSAANLIRLEYGHLPWLKRYASFLRWSLRQMWITIPNAMGPFKLGAPVSRTPFWLTATNPLANHPWKDQPDASLPGDADMVVIGAGFTGAGAAYHWSKRAAPDRKLVVIEMADAADGASGRNLGTVVMGRYFTAVRDTIEPHLKVARADLSPQQRRRLAEQFADVYCKAGYRNADLIEQTVEQEQFDIDYARNGWVQERSADQQEALAQSVREAERFGYTDWTAIDPRRVYEESGIRVEHAAGYSKQAGTWHPAKWVWSLLTAALRSDSVAYYSRTRCTGVKRDGDSYQVHTDRGTIRAKNVLYAVESYLARMDSRFRDVIEPHQEQLSSGDGAPSAMPRDNSITGRFYFGARREDTLLIGSDSTRVPDHLAGCNNPCRFLTKFALSEYHRLYGPFAFRLTNEWSGTVGYSLDQYPLVGSIDGQGEWMIGGMCGSGSGVAFNAARCIVNRVLQITDEPDDYPPAYFAPSRLLDPNNHPWPTIEESTTLVEDASASANSRSFAHH